MSWTEISPLSDCVLLFLFLQSLSASLNGKKAEAGPWIEILTSRDSDHLNKGEAVIYIFIYVLLAYVFVVLNTLIPLTPCITDSAVWTGDGEQTDGGSGLGEEVYRRLSTGIEGFR